MGCCGSKATNAAETTPAAPEAEHLKNYTTVENEKVESENRTAREFAVVLDRSEEELENSTDIGLSFSNGQKCIEVQSLKDSGLVIDWNAKKVAERPDVVVKVGDVIVAVNDVSDSCEEMMKQLEEKTVTMTVKRFEKVEQVTYAVGSRVQTQWTIAEGGDDQWYSGTVTTLTDSQITISYDDGSKTWTGDAKDVRALQEEPDPNCA